MKRKTRFGFNTGITFLFVLFVLICLIIFSALSLVSANANYKLNVTYSNHTSDYYDACNKATSIESLIDDELVSSYNVSSSLDEYYETLKIKLDAFSYSILLQESSISICYQVEVNETQNLDVILDCPYPLKAGESYYTINSWKLSSSKDWNPDNHLNLLP